MTKSTKLKKIIFAVISFILVILIAIVVFMFRIRHVYIDLDYCKEIGQKLGWLDLEQFCCGSIENFDDSLEVLFSFDLKEFIEYDRDKCISDIAEVRNTVTNYMNNHPSNELNNKRIAFIFHLFPGDAICMYNFHGEENPIQPDKFQYFEWLYVPLSSAQEFSDARIIELTVDENDDITVLEDWENLEKLRIGVKCLTEEKQEYLCEILPDCTIICNGEIINEGNIDNMN